MPEVSTSELAPLTGFPAVETRVYGIQENFLRASYFEYLHVEQRDMVCPYIAGSNVMDMTC